MVTSEQQAERDEKLLISFAFAETPDEREAAAAQPSLARLPYYFLCPDSLLN